MKVAPDADTVEEGSLLSCRSLIQLLRCRGHQYRRVVSQDSGENLSIIQLAHCQHMRGPSTISYHDNCDGKENPVATPWSACDALEPHWKGWFIQ
jgi:hypothetical protein